MEKQSARQTFRKPPTIRSVLRFKFAIRIRTVLFFSQYVRVVINENGISKIDIAKLGKYLRYSFFN